MERVLDASRPYDAAWPCAWTSSQCSWCGRLDVRSRPPRSARGASITSTSAPARRRSSCSASPWLDFGGRLRARAARSPIGRARWRSCWRAATPAASVSRWCQPQHAHPRRLLRSVRAGPGARPGAPHRVLPHAGTSWLNVAESELSCGGCLKDRRIGDIDTLRDEIAAWSNVNKPLAHGDRRRAPQAEVRISSN